MKTLVLIALCFACLSGSLVQDSRLASQAFLLRWQQDAQTVNRILDQVYPSISIDAVDSDVGGYVFFSYPADSGYARYHTLFGEEGENITYSRDAARIIARVPTHAFTLPDTAHVKRMYHRDREILFSASLTEIGLTALSMQRMARDSLFEFSKEKNMLWYIPTRSSSLQSVVQQILHAQPAQDAAETLLQFVESEIRTDVFLTEEHVRTRTPIEVLALGHATKFEKVVLYTSMLQHAKARYVVAYLEDGTALPAVVGKFHNFNGYAITLMSGEQAHLVNPADRGFSIGRTIDSRIRDVLFYQEPSGSVYSPQ